MPDLKWLPEALADIDRLHNFLKGKSPDAARRAVRIILEGAEILRIHPEVGRPMTDVSGHDPLGRREWLVPFRNSAYVLRYIIEDGTVAVIIRVWHSLEQRGP